MKILSLDSTAEVASVALVDEDALLASYTLESGNTHSTTLLPMIESVLSVLRLRPDDIDLLALSAGPGSFTGVRIGAANLKGIAFANNIPCIGVSSLEAMAWNLKELCGVVIPAINARRETLFTACFKVENGRVTRLTPDDTLPVSRVEEYIKTLSCPVYTVGDGASLIKAETSPLPAMLKKQNAYGVALLAKEIYEGSTDEEKKTFTHENLNPIYLKKSQAEREREERLEKEKSSEDNS